MIHISNMRDVEHRTAGEWCRVARRPEMIRAMVMCEAFSVETATGTATGRAGDALMEGATGQLYVLTADDFARCYEVLE